MKWNNRRLIFKPNDESFSLHSHASMPIAYSLGENLYRFYFSSRDKWNSSYVNFVEVDITKPTDILTVSSKAAFSKGELGHFDDNGVYSGPIVRMGDILYLFYSGRSNGVDTVYYMNIGLAVSTDNGKTFTRKKLAPVLGRSESDPWMVTAPSVIKKDEEWLMIYTSGTKIFDNGISNYDLKIAGSKDLIEWKQSGKNALSLTDDETNLSTPTIINHNGIYHMWFSAKGLLLY